VLVTGGEIERGNLRVVGFSVGVLRFWSWGRVGGCLASKRGG